MAESTKKVTKESNVILNSPDLLASLIQSKMDELEDQFKILLSLNKKRQVILEESFSFYQLTQVWETVYYYSIKHYILMTFAGRGRRTEV